MKLAAILILEVFNPLFAISFALFVSVGYIFSLLTPMTIDLWQALLIPCTLIPLAWLLSGAVKRSKQSQSDAYQFSWRVFLPLVVPAMVLAPGLYAIVSSPTVQILSHPDLHFGYINQLLYGSTPLENVFVAGYPANYYWLFHAFLAARGEDHSSAGAGRSVHCECPFGCQQLSVDRTDFSLAQAGQAAHTVPGSSGRICVLFGQYYRHR